MSAKNGPYSCFCSVVIEKLAVLGVKLLLHLQKLVVEGY